MSVWATSKWPLWVRAIVATLALLVLTGIALAALDHSYRQFADAELRTAERYRNAETLTVSGQRNGAYDLHYQASEIEEVEDRFAWRTPEEWIALLTGALVVFTFGLGLFTGLLWWETRAGARDASIRAREAEWREMRAYVGIESFVVEITDEANANSALAHIGFANFGKTPALNLRGYGFFMLLPWTESPFFPVVELDHFASRATLGPTARRTRTSRLKNGPFQMKDVTPVGNEAASHCMLAWGTLVYEDVFGATHRTYFKGYFGGNQFPFKDQSRGGATDYRMFTYWNGNESD
jgi:hypothetical protein